MLAVALSLAALVVVAVSAPTSAPSIAISVSAPSSAITLNHDLLSLSIEQDRWTDWVGESSPNTYFRNTLQNIQQRSGAYPWIRIGANSEDHTDFNPNIQYSEDIFPAPTAVVPYPEATNITVGYGYYELASHLPPGTKVIWGVNFGHDNITAAVDEAQAIHKAFTSPAVKAAGVTLELLEIGNEADLYVNNGARQQPWNISIYVDQWTEFAKQVAPAGGVTSGPGTKFYGAAFANSGHTTSSFSPQGIFANGILDTPQGKLISTISQHHYSGSFCSGSEGLLQDLMDKATIRSNLTGFEPDIAASNAQGFPYYLGETNSYACHGAPGVSNTAGAALWTLDYTLFASTIGIERVFFHEGIGFKYNLIQPITLTISTLDATPLPSPQPPHVQPQYYSAIIIAEAIGNSPSPVKISELSIDDDRLSGYTFFENGKVQRAVLIDSQEYIESDGGIRGEKNVTIGFSGNGAPRSIGVKRLAISSADDVSGLTWAGQSFETSSSFPSGSVTQETIYVQKAAATVTIHDTEAIMLSFQY